MKYVAMFTDGKGKDYQVCFDSMRELSEHLSAKISYVHDHTLIGVLSIHVEPEREKVRGGGK